MGDKLKFTTIGSTEVLVCDVSMNPWGQFVWTFEGGELPSNVLKSDNVITILNVEAYNIGNYTCTAINEILGATYHEEFGMELKLPGVPGQVTNLIVEASTSVSVTLGWTCGHNGGDDNMWFELYISKDGGEYEVYDDNIPADCSIGDRNRPDYRVRGLDSETEYTFEVKSSNSLGRQTAIVPTTVDVVTKGKRQLLLTFQSICMSCSN